MNQKEITHKTKINISILKSINPKNPNSDSA